MEMNPTRAAIAHLFAEPRFHAWIALKTAPKVFFGTGDIYTKLIAEACHDRNRGNARPPAGARSEAGGEGTAQP